MGNLTAKKVAGNLKAGMHGNGNVLYLMVLATGGKSWQLRCGVHGEMRYMGLGSAQFLSLAEARKLANHYRGISRAGGDLLAERRKAEGVPAFEEAARQVWAEQVEPTAKNEKHKSDWINSLRDYAFPVTGTRKVDGLNSAEVLSALQPICLEKPETTRRVRQWLRTVLD